MKHFHNYEKLAFRLTTPAQDLILCREDNLEEFGGIEPAELDHLEAEARRASGTGRAVIGNFG
jgi:hypothetical protein